MEKKKQSWENLSLLELCSIVGVVEKIINKYTNMVKSYDGSIVVENGSENYKNFCYYTAVHAKLLSIIENKLKEYDNNV